MLLRLSCVNKDQVALGYGLKLRQLQVVKKELLSAFMPQFKTRQQQEALNKEFEEKRMCGDLLFEKEGRRGPLDSDKTLDTGQLNRTPTVLELNAKKAFVVETDDDERLEIVGSDLSADVASNLWLQRKDLLQTMHTQSVKRALRLLEVAISHGGVQCLIASNFEKKGMGEPGEWHAQVVYMYVDWNKVLWLRNLKNMQLSDVMTSLPFSPPPQDRIPVQV